MKFALFLVNLLLANDKYNKLSVIKSLLSRSALNISHLSFWEYFKQSIVLSYRILYKFLSILFKLKKKPVDHLIFCFKTNTSVRIQHVKEYAEVNKIDIFDHDDHMDYFYYSSITIKKVIKLAYIFFIFQLSLIYSLFLKDRYSRIWIVDFFEILVRGLLNSGDQVSYYFYVSLNLKSYLSSFLLSTWLKEECIVISSSTPLFKLQRYTYLPDVSFRLCSKFQKEEAKLFIKLGWQKFKDIDLWGLEEIHITSKLHKVEPNIDLGYYSSAEWARNYYYWRESNFERIKSGVSKNNFYYKMFMHYLKNLIIYKNSKPNTSLKIYTHPFERKLKENYGIIPPYTKLATDNNISIDYELSSSLEKIYECKVGIAIGSSIIFDRWHMNLPGLIYSGRGYEREFLPGYYYKYMGKYQKYCFDNEKDLLNMIDKKL